MYENSHFSKIYTAQKREKNFFCENPENVQTFDGRF
jgi:hypothetical protein